MITFLKSLIKITGNSLEKVISIAVSIVYSKLEVTV